MTIQELFIGAIPHIAQWVIIGLLGFLIAQLKKIITNRTNDSKAIEILFSDRLLQKCLYHIDKQYCRDSDRRFLEMWYDLYHNKMGLNGVVEEAYNQVLELQYHKPKEETK